MNRYLEKLSYLLPDLYEEAKKNEWLQDLDLQTPELKRIPIVNRGNTVGFISIGSSSLKGVKVPIIDSIYVTPEHRNKGLSTKAISEVLTGKRGVAYIEPENLASIHTFEKAGFTKHKLVIGKTSGKKYWSMVKYK